MLASPDSVAEDMLESTDDDLPQRWHEKYRTIVKEWTGEKPNSRLQKWLEEVYFDDRKRQVFTREDIVKIGDLVRKLLRFEPSTRASVDEILQDPWFTDQQRGEPKTPTPQDDSGESSRDEASSEEVSKPQVVSVFGKVRP
jgi:serine/threonine-protein kinase SRPK3